MFLRRHRSSRSAHCSFETTVPDGLPGLLSRMALVLDVISGSTRSAVSVKSGYVSHEIGYAPHMVARCGYTTKYGSGMMTSSPGSSSAMKASINAPDVPLATSNPVSSSSIVPANVGLEMITQVATKRGDALRGGVTVAVTLHGINRRLLDFIGDRKVGLADREVDRVLQLGAQIEDAADARGIDGADAV